MDAVAYVNFIKVVMGGVERWVECKHWAREVYWRLEGVEAGLREVRVLEVFRNS